MNRRKFIGLVPAVPIGTALSEQNEVSVAVVAHSVSCSMEARRILLELGLTKVGVRVADAVLVVCRSALYNPLRSFYNTFCELDKDTENQLNISGMNFHIYIYSIDDDLRVRQLEHRSYEAI